jgi:hypothetical protein
LASSVKVSVILFSFEVIARRAQPYGRGSTRGAQGRCPDTG